MLKKFRLLYLIALVASASCVAPNYDVKVVSGTSAASPQEAAREVELAAQAFASQGWEPMGVGAGTTTISVEDQQVRIIDVFVLLRKPQ